MIKKIAEWLVSAIALLLLSRILPGIHFENFTSAVIAALVIGLMNILIKPLLILLTLPITILTLGLFTFVINAIVFMLASHFTPGFIIDSFWAALFGSIVYGLINSILHKLANL